MPSSAARTFGATPAAVEDEYNEITHTMKKTIMFAILVSAALAVGCRRDKIIPDKELGEILHDALLANSYVD